jgi:hypothetical protein
LAGGSIVEHSSSSRKEGKMAAEVATEVAAAAAEAAGGAADEGAGGGGVAEQGAWQSVSHKRAVHVIYAGCSLGSQLNLQIKSISCIHNLSSKID